MKIKIQKNSDQEVILSYFNIKDIRKSRFMLLKRIFEAVGEGFVLMIDTNQKKNRLSLDDISDALTKFGIKHVIRETPANEVKLFGISFDMFKKKKAGPEWMVVLDLTPEKFTVELYDTLLYNYDLAVGFGSTMALTAVAEKCAAGLNEVLFNETCFKNSIYDSGLFETMRSTIDISEIVKEFNKTL